MCLFCLPLSPLGIYRHRFRAKRKKKHGEQKQNKTKQNNNNNNKKKTKKKEREKKGKKTENKLGERKKITPWRMKGQILERSEYQIKKGGMRKETEPCKQK